MKKKSYRITMYNSNPISPSRTKIDENKLSTGRSRSQTILFISKGRSDRKDTFLRKVIILGLAGKKMNHIFSTLEILMNKLCHFEIALKSQGLNGKKYQRRPDGGLRERLYSVQSMPFENKHNK